VRRADFFDFRWAELEPFAEGDITKWLVLGGGSVLLLEGEFPLVLVVADQFYSPLDGDELPAFRLILLLPFLKKLLAGSGLYLGAVEELDGGVLGHDLETSVFADGVKFLTGRGGFELVETVLLEFLAVVGGSGLLVAFLSVKRLPDEVQLHGVVGLQSRVAVVAVSDVQVLDPKRGGGVLEALLSGLCGAVQRCHIINTKSLALPKPNRIKADHQNCRICDSMLRASCGSHLSPFASSFSLL
jgi:hypothetical protein